MAKSQRSSPPPVAPRTWIWFGTAALVWATVVIIMNFRYFVRTIPVSLSLYLQNLSDEFVFGPHFAEFWTAHLLRVAGCALFFLGAWSVGRLILRRALGDADNVKFMPLNTPFSLGLGLGVLGYTAFGLVAVGLAGKPVMISLYAALCLAGLRGAWAAMRGRGGTDAGTPASRPDVLEKMIGAFFLLTIAYVFLGTTIPEIFYDAQVYHLAVPQTYLLAGRMVDMPYNHYSYLPLFTSMLYFWALAVDGMYSAKLINFSIGICLLIAVYRWGNVLKDRALGLIACAIVLSTPLVIYLFWMSGSDLGAAFFSILALAAAWRWLQENSEHDRMLYLSAIFNGLALASKYTTVFGAIITFPFLAWTAWRKNRRGAWRAVFLYGVLIMLPVLPWLARNYVYTGNPVYPYLVETLGPQSADADLLKHWRKETSQASPGFNPFLLIEKMWSDAISGQNLTANYVGPLFVGFFLLVLCVWNESWVKMAVLYSYCALILGLSATYITRLLLLYFIPLALVIAYAIISLKTTQKVWAAALLIATIIFNVYQSSIVILLTTIEGLSVATGRVTQAEYLRQPRDWHPNPTYGAYQFVAGLGLHPQDRILIIGESRSFYSPNLSISNAPYDVPVIFSWANEAKNLDELYAKLKSENISIVISNPRENARKYSAGYISQRGLKLLAAMLDKYFVQAYDDSQAIVFKLKT